MNDLKSLLENLENLTDSLNKVKGKPSKEEREKMPRFGVDVNSEGEKRYFLNTKDYEVHFAMLEAMHRRIEFLKFKLAEKLPEDVYAKIITKALMSFIVWLEVFAAKAAYISPMLQNGKVEKELIEDFVRLKNIYDNDYPKLHQTLIKDSLDEIDELLESAKNAHEKVNG